jgi:hypothetical protein
VQREAGRLLANLCADDGVTSDAVLEGGGHQLLISFLLSQDTSCQRVGALGIGNLCTQERHRKTLMQVGALEPLCTLARSEDVELEIQRYAVLAIANLASETENHPGFVEEGMLPLLISLSNVPDQAVTSFLKKNITYSYIYIYLRIDIIWGVNMYIFVCVRARIPKCHVYSLSQIFMYEPISIVVIYIYM